MLPKKILTQANVKIAKSLQDAGSADPVANTLRMCGATVLEGITVSAFVAVGGAFLAFILGVFFRGRLSVAVAGA